MEKKKLNKELIKALESGNIEIQLNALDKIRKEGFADYLPVIADLYAKIDSVEVKDKISSIFQDLKDTNGVDIIMDVLNHTSNVELCSMLLTACWSSSLDFSSYLEDFVTIALEGEYMLIFEVITVIENFEYSPDTELLERSVKRVQTSISEKRGAEGEMLDQLLTVLKSF
jgi:hypothetical protein